ncbi:MAG: cation:proton antiporter [Candidatus Omnitrophica bacterium]|nr:cation:proton antiporter [Candidatus Omnitrophota bacterium]
MEEFIFDLSIILVGSAILSFLAVLTKQPIIIAYILCGVLIGPWGIGWIKHAAFIETISHLGITLLLFLAGLCLHPQKLLRLFKKTSLVTLGNCCVSFVVAFSVALLFGFTKIDSLLIGLALMFSSTILTIKLLPTTRLHHERMGAICISVLIMEDLLAIAVLAFVRCIGTPQGALISFGLLFIKLVFLIALLVVFEQFILRKIMRYVDRLHEVLFVLGLAWCFGIASVSNHMGLFYETGAFFAGVVLARHPVSLFISERLKPLRDFFLVLFFFTLGAKLNFLVMKDILLPAIVFAALFVVLKPLLFWKMFEAAGEKTPFAQETGLRLGQLSEFSLLIALLAFQLGHISNGASQLIQLITIFTLIISSYLVVLKYPTPIGTSKKLIQT